MIANYHTHTARCRHAGGKEIEYVENAIASGLQIFGFSDHTPQWFPGNYYSTMRMYPHQLEDYCNTVRQLQQRFRGQIEIPLGLEVEYYPAVFGELIPRLQDAGIEYILLGQHWIHNEFDGPYSGLETDNIRDLEQYCNQVIAAMETGYFTYLAHPDLIHFTGDVRVYQQQVRRICRAAKETHTPLELNFLGFSSGRHYPNKDFWSIAAEEGVDTVFGIDAHLPQSVFCRDTEVLMQKFANTFCLQVLPTVPLKKV